MTGRSKAALMAAFAVDNVGSGLFLPLAVFYAVRAVGLPVGVAGTVVGVAGLAGFAVPPLAGRLAHARGAKQVVVLAQLLQGAGALLYLVAQGPVTVFAAAQLMSTGLQFFYCSLTLLIADATAAAAKERAFARVGQVRSLAFGLGNFAAAGAIALGGDRVLRWLVGLDGLTFLVSAVLLVVLVDATPADHGGAPATGVTTVLRDRRYVAMMTATFLLVLTTDTAPIGLPVYLTEVLHGPAWLAPTVLAISVVLSSVLGVRVVDALRGRRRTRSMQAGGLVYLGWSLAAMAMLALPSSWVVPYGLLVLVLLVAGNKVVYPMSAALSDALAPRHARAGYLATYQYAFTLAQSVGPLVVALFALADWAPWGVLVGTNLAGVLVLGWIGTRLRDDVNRAQPELVSA